MRALDDALRAAHQRAQGPEIARLYAKAAQNYEGDLTRASFYLTHAYVFALEAGMPEAKDYHAQLKSWGKEQ